MDRRRLLIASPFPHFLAEFVGAISSHFEVQRANSDDMVNFLCKEWSPHLLLVDGDSPFFNQCFVFRQRTPTSRLGLVLITRDLSLSREERAWKNGCDHVMTSPNSAELLILRLNALGTRIVGGTLDQNPEVKVAVVPPRREPIQFGELRIHPLDHMVRRGELLLSMTPLQFKLLLMFLNHREQLLSRAWIKETIWGATDISLRSIDAQISKLRKIVPELDSHLINIYGKGYVFTENQREQASAA